MNRKAVAICIVGSARSGTSATAIGLEQLGVYLGNPEHLNGADGFNPDGYRENALINHLNLETLLLFPSFATANPVLPANWEDHPASQRILENYRGLFSQYFQNQPLWGWKDPRTSILLPIYQRAFEGMDLEVRTIMPLRNPLDSARSIMKRDGCSFNVGLGLWTHYVLSSLNYLKGTNLYVFDYETYLVDPYSCLEPFIRTIESAAPSGSNWKSLKESVRPGLNHGTPSESEVIEQLPASVRRTFNLAQRVKADLFGFAKGSYNLEIADLWADWNEYRSLRNSYSPQATVTVTGIDSKPVELKLAPRFGWSRMEVFGSGPKALVNLTFNPVGWVYFIRNAVWVSESGESVPVRFEAMPGAYLAFSDDGICQVLPHGEGPHLRFRDSALPASKLSFELQHHWGSQMTAVTLARLGRESVGSRANTHRRR